MYFVLDNNSRSIFVPDNNNNKDSESVNNYLVGNNEPILGDYDIMIRIMIMRIITLYVSMSLEPVETMESGSVLPHSLISKGDLCQ
jgi:hypothetical protein